MTKNQNRKADIFIFDGNVRNDADRRSIQVLVERLIAISQSPVLLRPGKVTQLPNLQQLGISLPNWPAWHSRPWIIGGHLKETKREILVYDGPFVENTSTPDFDKQLKILAANYDWAIFSYFTTYQDDMLTFMTTQPDVLSQLPDKELQRMLIETYQGSTPFQHLYKNVTFDDHEEEGWLAYELAMERGESFPLLLCAINVKSGGYHMYNHETGTCENELWYEKPLSKLELVCEFKEIPSERPWQMNYFLYRVVDFDAYRELWSMECSDSGIVEASISSDCDIARLKELFSGPDEFDIIRQGDEVGSWIYGLIHGGGGSEYHAIFHARDCTLTQRIWEMAGDYAISRF